MADLPSLLWLVVLVLVSYRVTRFFVFDALLGSHLDSGTKWSQRLDQWAFDQNGNDRSFVRGKVGTLLSCFWCLGGWVSLGVVCVGVQLWPWQLGVTGLYVWVAVWAVQCVASKLDHRFAPPGEQAVT